MTNDEETQEDVLQALRCDTRIDAAEIGVTVDAGVVTLSGVVMTFAEREAAEEEALRVEGVHDVANEIQVQVPGRHVCTDPALAEAVRSALEWRSSIPGYRIKTTVTNGIVTLYGTLDSWQQVADAESVVGEVDGVRDVVNELVVSPPLFIETHAAQADTESVLERLMR